MFKKKGETIKTKGAQEEPDEAVMREIKLLARGVEEALGRLGELEGQLNRSDGAQVIAAKQAYATPPENLSEYTIMSLRMVDPFSLADACHSILSPDVQYGAVSLSEIRRRSIYKHLRSVKGYLLDRCTKLAEQQEVNKLEPDYEKADLGKGF
jgi:hypothetical protein